MGKLRFADEEQEYAYEDEEMYEEISEAAAIGAQEHPFDALSEVFDEFSKEDLLNACMHLVRQKAQYREILVNTSVFFRNRADEIG